MDEKLISREPEKSSSSRKHPFFIRSFLTFLIFFSVFSLVNASSTYAAEKSSATTLWDNWGVPHIFATSNEGLFYAFGRAQMQNHANLLLTLYGEARGRAAEYWGANYLANDEFVQTMGFPEHAQQWYDAQTPEFRHYIDAFVAGMNNYAQQYPSEIDPQFKEVLPIRATDVMAHGERVMANFLLSDCSAVLASFGQKGNNGQAATAGSNGWAIGPAHSADGKAMLLANPHLAWSEETTFFEAQLTSPSISVYGAALVGFPVLSIAFNNNLSWTHTVNTIDTCDGYTLTLAGNGYLLDGREHPFETQTHTLLVKQSDGTLQAQQLVVRRSVQGPVFVLPGRNGTTQNVAIRMIGVDQFPAYHIWQEWWNMGRARNLQEFQAALRPLQLPMFTVIYADRVGHIMSLFNGEVPKRPFGDWNYWINFVPGDTSKTLWTTLTPYSGLPKVIDPPSGWVQNSNSPPWFTTFPQAISPQHYPAYMAPTGPISLREQRGVQMLTEQQRISFAQLINAKFSSHMELADRILDELISAAHTYGGAQTQQAANVLQNWDRTADAGSKGSVLFYAWMNQMQSSNAPLFATPWDAAHPLTTPSGLADPQVAVSALDTAAQEVLSLTGSLDVSWGQVFRLQRGSVDLPASGAPGNPYGSFRVLYFTSGSQGRFKANFGDSYIAAVEFSTPLRAQVLLTYGNASQADSIHNGDQLTLYAHNQMRDALLTLPAINAHLASRDFISLAA